MLIVHMPRVGIDKGIPMLGRSPRAGRGPGGIAKYPWRDMDVGDSFAMRDWLSRKDTLAASSVILAAQKATGRKFAQRLVEENGKRIVRVWRVA